MSLTRAAVARELIRRKRCQESLHSYALSIQMPTVPAEPMCPDEDLLGPASAFMARHHAVMLESMQRTMMRPMGRALYMLPPGSAKSLYADCVATTWYMGKFPGSRLMLTGYQGDLAERQSRRAMFICEQEAYRQMWPENPVIEKNAAKDWLLSNRSNMLAMGLTGGLTGNRANGWIIDDPIPGRKEADSETQRQDVYNAYKDDLLTRCLPNAWGFVILTRWHEDDLAGRILPDDYDGRSGMIRCTDGLDWEVLNIPAKCERTDDPLGRKLGEYIWPEYYPLEHWKMFEEAQGPESARTWSSLYQQRPTPQGSGRFAVDMFDFYDIKSTPPYLAYVAGYDAAVSEGKNDFSEIGVFGVDTQGDLWEVDWWNGQVTTDKMVEELLRMRQKWKFSMGFNEGGVIDKATRPWIHRRMREIGYKATFDLRSIPSMADKVAKCSNFQGMAASGRVHLRDNANSRRIVQQLVSLPAGRYDDAADVCGLIGRAVDQFPVARMPPSQERPKGPKPFTGAWLEHQEDEKPKVRWR
jgi:predicted phage terminase large subunit-like protein